MNLLIPINSENNLCSMEENSAWALASLDNGTLKQLDTYEKKEDINELIDYVVVISSQEFISEFFIEGIGILVAPMQRSIEDIVEAYMFRELHEVTS
ncbi:hypothetical protein [Sulfurospirillum arcachonense]|uniref:hypothetical protein n=1 Tax=Sulfurospirillum arcachonense TaxID=57666 RepID=UPI0004681B32|nr:hypothetical protein [Sulfurospirillum arcachonense]